jgi:hypothetical protein
MVFDGQLERRALGTDNQGDTGLSATPPATELRPWAASITTPPAEAEKSSAADCVYTVDQVTAILALAREQGTTTQEQDGLTEEALLRRAADFGTTPEALSKALATYNARQEHTSALKDALTQEREQLGLPVDASVDQVLLERGIRRDVDRIMREMTESVSTNLKGEEQDFSGQSSWLLRLPKSKVTFSGFGPLDRDVLRAAGWDVLKVAGCSAALAWGNGPLFGVAALYGLGVVADVLFGRTQIPTLFGPNLSDTTSSPALNELLAFCKENGITAKYNRAHRSFFRDAKETETPTTISLTFEIDRRSTSLVQGF